MPTRVCVRVRVCACVHVRVWLLAEGPGEPGPLLGTSDPGGPAACARDSECEHLGCTVLARWTGRGGQAGVGRGAAGGCGVCRGSLGFIRTRGLWTSVLDPTLSLCLSRRTAAGSRCRTWCASLARGRQLNAGCFRRRVWSPWAGGGRIDSPLSRGRTRHPPSLSSPVCLLSPRPEVPGRGVSRAAPPPRLRTLPSRCVGDAAGLLGVLFPFLSGGHQMGSEPPSWPRCDLITSSKGL